MRGKFIMRRYPKGLIDIQLIVDGKIWATASCPSGTPHQTDEQILEVKRAMMEGLVDRNRKGLVDATC